jgi:hypothetical protein
MRTLPLLLASALAVSPPAHAVDLASAQNAPVRVTLAEQAALVDAASGETLRTLPRGARLDAWLRGAERTSLLLELADGTLARVERAALERAQMGRPRRPGHVGRAAMLGALAGLALGAVGVGTCNDTGQIISCDEIAGPALVLSAALGLAVGGIVGRATSGTRWREIDDLRPRASAERPRFTPGVALSLRF